MTNRSSKRSNYLITIALVSADGTTQIDTSSMEVQNIEPGQSTTQTGTFYNLTGKPPANAKVVLQVVRRGASS